MAKNPVLPLYYNDITTSTQDWSDEEFGAYMRLLIHQWRQGGLPNDYQRLTRIATSLDKNWALLKPKFELVDGLLKNRIMEEIREKKAKHSEKQSNNVLNRYQKSTKHGTKNIPLEEEIEKEKEILIDKEPVISIDEKLSGLDDIYLDQQRIKWPHIDFDFEYRSFCEKVRGSPDHYRNHDTSGIRLAFQHQLRNAKPKQNGQNQSKQQRNTNDLIEGWAKRNHGNGGAL